ncbi:MAG TPA: TatD family hydrolase [Puia sp.]|nr:TatD family hydrolase [Puia sp.]
MEKITPFGDICKKWSRRAGAPMKLIDTHCHLYNKEFDRDREEMIQRADLEGVERFYLPMVDSGSRAALLDLEVRYPGICVGMTGLHPTSVKEDYTVELRIVEEDLARRPWAAVGEIGLDFYWDRTFECQQYEAFHLQIEWAVQYRLPIVIHSRDSMKESIGVVREHRAQGVRGVFHCFGGSVEDARAIVDLGFYLGIGGVLTYKNSLLPDVLREIPLDSLVLETDAPYLAPVPYRGKRNEPAYLRYVVERLAEVKGVSVEDVAAVTTANAEKLFGR